MFHKNPRHAGLGVVLMTDLGIVLNVFHPCILGEKLQLGAILKKTKNKRDPCRRPFVCKLTDMAKSAFRRKENYESRKLRYSQKL